VSDEDRETVQTSYEMMSAIPDWEPTPPDVTTPAYVMAGGVDEDGDDWRLEVRPSRENIRLSLVGDSLVAASSDFVDPRSVIEWAATDPIFGAVTKQATAVEFRSEDDPSVAIAGTIVPLPPSLPFDFDLFFIEGTAGIDGEAVAVGPDGDVIEGDTSVGTPREGVVTLSGSLLGHDWSARFSGAFADESACIRVPIGEPYHPLCPKQLETSLAGQQPSLHGWLTDQLMVFAGSVPPEVVEVRFTSDDGTQPPSQSRCQLGPIGWTDPDKNVCAIALPPEGSGTLQYLDETGAVLFEDGNSWAASPTPVEPLHGQTYWAVYPWVGAPGDREADDVSASLLQEFGIEAFPGDLACDEGAAEALGTNAEQGIGVYFATQDEANAFADQAGLLGHEADPVIARVTTYCLD
jgi:hypothetical protein